MSYDTLAAKGRNGDNDLRMVNGNLEHVNSEEAHWIDNWGPLGELLTQSVGSRTTNPNTGLRENWFPQAVGLGLQAYSMWNEMEGKKTDASNLASNMQPWQENTKFIQDKAHQMIDPNSQLNRSHEANLRTNALDTMATQNMLSSRNAAQGGFGGYSGINQAQDTANMGKMNQGILQMLQNSRKNNFTQGMNLLGNVGGNLQEYGTMQTNRDIAGMSNTWEDIIAQLGQGIFDFIPETGSERIS